MSPINFKDVEMAITILKENPGLFGETITKMFIEHFTQWLLYNKKNSIDEGYAIVDNFNLNAFRIVFETPPYQLYKNLNVLQTQMKRNIFNG